MDSIIDFFHNVRDLLNPKFLIDWMLAFLGGYVYLGLWFVIFAETGLAVGFFLPGDSLLFLVGTVAAAGNLNIVAVNIVLMSAAVLGDTFRFALGCRTGPKIFKRPDSRLFRREHLERTHAFYEKHGGKTIIYARFVPIVRTFAPFVAGVGRMDYGRFLSFNVFGGIGWVFAITMLGYGLGGISIVKQNLEKVILAIILISVAPVILEAVKAYRKPKAPVV